MYPDLYLTYATGRQQEFEAEAARYRLARSVTLQRRATLREERRARRRARTRVVRTQGTNSVEVQSAPTHTEKEWRGVDDRQPLQPVCSQDRS